MLVGLTSALVLVSLDAPWWGVLSGTLLGICLSAETWIRLDKIQKRVKWRSHNPPGYWQDRKNLICLYTGIAAAITLKGLGVPWWGICATSIVSLLWTKEHFKYLWFIHERC